MTSYKIYVNDRSYTSWEVFDTNNFNKITLDINPLESKLLSNDVFTVNKDNTINLIHSSVRSGPAMPAVLILAGNKTYGRQNKMKEGQTYTKKHSDMAGGKLLYKCIPDDMRLPSFLVPYEIKNMGFSKVFKNLYVTIVFDQWEDKHPRAKLDNVIGPVDILDNFYEYQLYCKSLYASIQTFNKDASDALKQKTEPEFISTMIEKYKLVDRTHEPIFSIDSKETTDYDDAFSIIDNGDNSYKVSIYIANVPMWMEELALWNSFSERISTIYLPDRKRPMMPLSLSNCVCSLCEQVVRLAFAIDITIVNGKILGYTFTNTYIKVYKNHVYESKELKEEALKRLIKTLEKNMSPL